MVYPEELLHFIWRYRLYDHRNLITREGEALKIMNTGVHNNHAGPDFEFAHIELAGTKWSGHIEMHINEDDWTNHGHHLDPAYNNTVLHVVWHAGNKINVRKDGSIIPTLVLYSYVDESLLRRYEMLRKERSYIACEGRIAEIIPVLRPGWIDRFLVERIIEKSNRCLDWLAQTQNNWEHVFLVALGRAFGMKVNSQVFEELMLRMDVKLLLRYKDDPLKISSLVFGLAGFLTDDYKDDYYIALKNEFKYLRHLHHIQVMSKVQWKFMRMRPYNFPTYRLAQLSSVLTAVFYSFDKITTISSLEELLDILRGVKMVDYWKTHFRFNKLTKEHSVTLTNGFLQHLAINCIVPVVFAYGQYMGKDDLKARALNWLAGLPPESNHITQYFETQGLNCSTAGDSQALLTLKANYCERKACLNCVIGLTVLKQ